MFKFLSNKQNRFTSLLTEKHLEFIFHAKWTDIHKLFKILHLFLTRFVCLLLHSDTDENEKKDARVHRCPLEFVIK